MKLEIRPPRAADEAAWRTLWAAYNHFYRAEMAADVTTALWQKLLAPSGDITAVMAAEHAIPVGFAHILFHPSTWSLQPSCYLEDLFVAPAARGTQAAHALIDACADAARARGAERLYWHTQEFS